jgi:hypothetical protein
LALAICLAVNFWPALPRCFCASFSFDHVHSPFSCKSLLFTILMKTIYERNVRLTHFVTAQFSGEEGSVLEQKICWGGNEK